MAWTTTAISATFLTWASRSNLHPSHRATRTAAPRRWGFAAGALPRSPLGAPPPWPAFKKAGENWLENVPGFPAEHAGGPLMGSGPLAWHGKTPAEGGGGWALRALKERPRGFCPRGRSFVWRPRGGPAGRPSAAKRRRPPRNPTFPVSPGPARLRRHYGGCSWEAGMSGRTRRGRSRAPPVAEEARRKPSEQGS